MAGSDAECINTKSADPAISVNRPATASIIQWSVYAVGAYSLNYRFARLFPWSRSQFVHGKMSK